MAPLTGYRYLVNLRLQTASDGIDDLFIIYQALTLFIYAQGPPYLRLPTIDKCKVRSYAYKNNQLAPCLIVGRQSCRI